MDLILKIAIGVGIGMALYYNAGPVFTVVLSVGLLLVAFVLAFLLIQGTIDFLKQAWNEIVKKVGKTPTEK